MSEKCIELLHSKKFLLSLKCVNIDLREICVYGKEKESGFCEGWKGKEK